MRDALDWCACLALFVLGVAAFAAGIVVLLIGALGVAAFCTVAGLVWLVVMFVKSMFEGK